MMLLPIGSVLQSKEEKAVVLGYDFNDENDVFSTSYVVCGYPIGFTTTDHLGIVPVDAEMEVVFKGYQNKSYTSFIKSKEELYQLTGQMTVSEWNCHLEQAARIAGLEETDG